MDYRFLSNKGLEKFFDESELSIGEIIRAITREKLTGIKIENKSRITELSDKEWYKIINQAFEDERED